MRVLKHSDGIKLLNYVLILRHKISPNTCIYVHIRKKMEVSLKYCIICTVRAAPPISYSIIDLEKL